MSPDELIEFSISHKLLYHGATLEDAMCNLIGTLSQHGKFGLFCKWSSQESAKLFTIKHYKLRILIAAVNT